MRHQSYIRIPHRYQLGAACFDFRRLDHKGVYADWGILTKRSLDRLRKRMDQFMAKKDATMTKKENEKIYAASYNKYAALEVYR